jgi:hypothetical protein
LLWLGQEGISTFSTWELSEEQKNDPNYILEKFGKHVEPKSNFRINRFNLQKIRQSADESIDQFMTGCKIQANKCKFSADEYNERLIEQLIIIRH